MQISLSGFTRSASPINRLGTIWESLRSSLWFVPALLVLVGMALAVVLVEAESFVDRERLVQEWPRLFGAGAEGARGMLSAIASSMITVAGVVFSITTVSFTLASSQYTSRILRTFMRDRGNQTVLGVFLGVFAYCLVVLRTIRGGDEGVFVPTLAVLGAFLLAVLAIGFLVFFIHHVAASIQASSIIESVAGETIKAVDRLYPEPLRGAGEDSSGSSYRLAESVQVQSSKIGYVQALDHRALLALAREENIMIHMAIRAGDFVYDGKPLAMLSGSSLKPRIQGRVNAALSVGRHRTMQQDASYGIRQIVDIALKALSPGINDTTTAMICLDYLGAILVRLAGRELGPRDLGENGSLRLVLRHQGFGGFLAEGLDQIRENAAGNTAVLSRMLEILSLLAPQVSGDRAAAVHAQARAVLETVQRTVPSRAQRQEITAGWHEPKDPDGPSA